MPRQALEVADIFRDHGPAWRRAQAGHLSLGQLQVMSAITQCRTATLGGHVEQCTDCGHTQIAYNSCRNRHCPKCQGAVAKQWLAAREADLLPVEYYHVVFTLPAPIGQLAYHNKAVIYALLFAAAAETLLTIAADPNHLGARIGLSAVLHTWGSALTHHPHLHCIVPGGGISLDGERWVACRRGFFLPVRVLSRLLRRLFCEKLAAAHQAGELQFFGEQAGLAETTAFGEWLQALRQRDWVVYAKRPFAGPQVVLAYLSRYTHRVAIANRRLITLDEKGVTFKFKDYRAKGGCRYGRITLTVDEFMRRFLLHVLPRGFHRIRHYGLLANAARVEHLARARELLGAKTSPLIAVPVRLHEEAPPAAPTTQARPCPCCGAPMLNHLNLGACSCPACTTIGHGRGGMNIAAIIPRASAPFAHRLGVGEPDAVHNAARSSLAPQPSPLRASRPPTSSGPFRLPEPAAHPSHRLLIASETRRQHSNPHSTIPALASSFASRGFLPRGLSDAYRRPR